MHDKTAEDVAHVGKKSGWARHKSALSTLRTTRSRVIDAILFFPLFVVAVVRVIAWLFLPRSSRSPYRNRAGRRSAVLHGIRGFFRTCFKQLCIECAAYGFFLYNFVMRVPSALSTI